MSNQPGYSTQPLRQQELTARKDQRRQDILAAGLQLCLAQGVAAVEMKDVAYYAQVSRATLYRYFPNKRDLVFAILLDEAANRIAPTYHPARLRFVGSGLEKFQWFLEQIADALRRFPDFFRVMAMVDVHYGGADSAEVVATLYQQMFPGLLVADTPAQFLLEGQRDGSVRGDIDPHLYMMTALATISSLAQHIALSIAGAQLLYGVESPVTMVETAIWAFVKAVAAAPLVAGSSPTNGDDADGDAGNRFGQ